MKLPPSTFTLPGSTQPQPATRGFSMVEVTVALGLVAFCLLALIGLLPIGLDSQKDSMTESAAISCLEHISGSIREALPDPNEPGTYRAGGRFSDLSWKLDGVPVEFTGVKLSASGYPATNPTEEHFVAHIEVQPPSLSPADRRGTALIRLAWPPQATWDASKSAWQNARGSSQTWVAFLSN